MAYNLTAKEREEAFPIHIELGKDAGNVTMPMEPKAGKNKAPKKYYPTVYIDQIPGLEQLPKKGCMLVEFVRKELRIGEDSSGVTLELHTICLQDGKDENAPRDLESAMNSYGKDDAEEADETMDDDEEDET